jgi:DNA-binding NarL/FixJ family response regulator
LFARKGKYIKDYGVYIPPQIADSLAQRFEVDDLTDREIEILHLVAEGNSNKIVGDCLSITEETVKSHMKNVIGKLRASLDFS